MPLTSSFLLVPLATSSMRLTLIKRRHFSHVGVLKVRASLEVSCTFANLPRPFSSCSLDPRWADPIKDKIRRMNQAKAVNEVVGALKPTASTVSSPDRQLPLLRVVNGMSSTASSTITTAARENVPVTSVSPTSPKPVNQIPTGRPGGSTLRWAAGLPVHHENADEDRTDIRSSERSPPRRPLPELPKPITPSLATLEKAVAAKIYFENLYWPLLRHTPSREQRRVAMEKDMMHMQLNEAQKEYLRDRWRQNETDYLRDRRRKVDVSAFIKLKTIGHGMFAAAQVAWFADAIDAFRCIWRCLSCSRALHRATICNETGTISGNNYTVMSMYLIAVSVAATKDRHVTKRSRRTCSCRERHPQIGIPCQLSWRC